jgi:hypothetical protein
MKFTDILFETILNEYKETLVQKLIEKFKAEQPNLTDDIIRRYIGDFKRVSSKLENKDITTYTWKELEIAVDSNKSTRIKAGKIDVTAEDANLLYNNDGIRLYHGNGKKACIKYSNGYSFCIGARGKDNMYGYYRHQEDMHSLSGRRYDTTGAPYFVFNDNLPKSDPQHILVIFAFYKYPRIENEVSQSNKPFYTVTNANNDGDEDYQTLDLIVNDFPWVSNLKQFIKPTPLSQDENNYFKEDKLINDQIYIKKRDISDYIRNMPDTVKDAYKIIFNTIINSYNGVDYDPEKNFNILLNGGMMYYFDCQPSNMPFNFASEGVPVNKLYKYVANNCDEEYAVLATDSTIQNIMIKEAKTAVRDLKKVFNEAYEQNPQFNLPNDFDDNADKILNAILREFQRTVEVEIEDERENMNHRMAMIGFTERGDDTRTYSENNGFVKQLKELFPLYEKSNILKKKYNDLI